jgi:micrococcal nuclease
VLTASVLKIVDGDTIDVRLEGCTVRVRSIGVNTPETSHPMKGVEPFGKEAKEATRRLVEGQTVRLERDVEQYDRYGLLLAYVDVGDTMVNAEWVRQGYTRVATFPPKREGSGAVPEAPAGGAEGDAGVVGGRTPPYGSRQPRARAW